MAAPRATGQRFRRRGSSFSCPPDLSSPPFDLENLREAGEIRAALEARGTPIGPYDILIAAQARRRGATLVTLSPSEFERVPGLLVVDWADGR